MTQTAEMNTSCQTAKRWKEWKRTSCIFLKSLIHQRRRAAVVTTRLRCYKGFSGRRDAKVMRPKMSQTKLCLFSFQWINSTDWGRHCRICDSIWLQFQFTAIQMLHSCCKTASVDGHSRRITKISCSLLNVCILTAPIHPILSLQSVESPSQLTVGEQWGQVSSLDKQLFMLTVYVQIKSHQSTNPWISADCVC